MKKSVWIFLFAVLLPSVVLGWLALRSAEEQQIIFERRTAELYQKETEALAVTVRDTVDAKRRMFGETVHRLLAKGDADALARDFTNTLADAWEVKAVGFAINRDGKLVSPSVVAASKQPELQRFLLGNGGFLTSTEPAIVYNWAGDNNAFRNNKLEYVKGKSGTSQSTANTYFGVTGVVSSGGIAGKDVVNDGGAVSAGTLGMGSRQDAGAGTLVLNGTTQAMNQQPGGTSAFDFSGVMRAQNQQGMDNAKRLADAPSGTAMPILMPEKPVAHPYARIEATRQDWATNYRHEYVELSPLERILLPLLDGTRGRLDLLKLLPNELTVGSDGDTENERTLDDALEMLAKGAFFPLRGEETAVQLPTSPAAVISDLRKKAEKFSFFSLFRGSRKKKI